MRFTITRWCVCARVRRCAVISGNFISPERQRLAWLLGGLTETRNHGEGRKEARSRCFPRKMQVTLIAAPRFRAHRDRHYCYYSPLFGREANWRWRSLPVQRLSLERKDAERFGFSVEKIEIIFLFFEFWLTIWALFESIKVSTRFGDTNHSIGCICKYE